MGLLATFSGRARKKKDFEWCKVEDGYIINLKGEKKNKIPFDYES